MCLLILTIYLNVILVELIEQCAVKYDVHCGFSFIHLCTSQLIWFLTFNLAIFTVVQVPCFLMEVLSWQIACLVKLSMMITPSCWTSGPTYHRTPCRRVCHLTGSDLWHWTLCYKGTLGSSAIGVSVDDSLTLVIQDLVWQGHQSESSCIQLITNGLTILKSLGLGRFHRSNQW